MDLKDLLKTKREDILRIAAKYGASNVRVFGSVARGDADEKSDIDLLVDLEDGRTLFDHASLILDLQALLGRKVDVAIDGGLKPRVRENVMRDAVPI
jgi:predicted nucleotidyltransferase